MAGTNTERDQPVGDATAPAVAAIGRRRGGRRRRFCGGLSCGLSVAVSGGLSAGSSGTFSLMGAPSPPALGHRAALAHLGLGAGAGRLDDADGRSPARRAPRSRWARSWRTSPGRSRPASPRSRPCTSPRGARRRQLVHQLLGGHLQRQEAEARAQVVAHDLRQLEVEQPLSAPVPRPSVARRSSRSSATSWAGRGGGAGRKAARLRSRRRDRRSRSARPGRRPRWPPPGRPG